MDKKKRPLIQKKSKKSSQDLSDRHKVLTRKLNALKSKQKSETLHTLQPTPKINPKSRRLASKSQTSLITSENRIRRTHEILKSSQFMPKKVKLSLSSLKSFPKTSRPSPRALRYDCIFTSPQAQSPITFPSITCLTDFTMPDEMEDFPADISKRNKLLMSLKTEPEPKEKEKEYLGLPLEKRTHLWLKKKNERMNSLRSERESRGMEDCTFRPTFMSQPGSRRTTPKAMSCQSSFSKRGLRTRSQISLTSGRTSIVSSKSENEDHQRIYKQFSTSGSSSVILNNICPLNVNISYHSGFSNSLRKKSKPMISYKVLNVKP